MTDPRGKGNIYVFIDIILRIVGVVLWCANLKSKTMVTISLKSYYPKTVLKWPMLIYIRELITM